MKIKKFLNDILQEELRPIREKREKLEKNPEYVYSVLKEGTKKARIKASETLKEVKEAMKINYFDNDSLLHELKNR
jgi:tryptophanyl-tRNA synthetase